MDNIKENKNKKALGRGLGSLLGGVSSSATSSSVLQKETEKKLEAPIKALSQSENVKQTVIPSQDRVVVNNDKTATVTEHKTQGSLNTQINSPLQQPAVQVVEKTVVVEQKIDEDKRIWTIGVDKLVPGQFQPRKKFDKETLQELAQSIKENGILQPIVVRKRQAGGFEIIAGERRWRAAQLAGIHQVPVIVKSFTNQEALQLALIENIQREDLDPIEEAESYQRLMDEFDLSQQQVAEKVGKERSTVANALRLLLLPVEVKNALAEKQISVGHAKVLLSVDNRFEQIKLVKAIAEKNLSVRALESLIKNKENNESKSNDIENGETQKISQDLAVSLAQKIQKALGTKTIINYKSGRGEIIVKFYNDEQLNDIADRLVE